MAAKLYCYEVTHHEYGTVVVEAISPETATVQAAKKWDVSWNEVAGECRTRRLGTAAKPRCRRCYNEFGEPGDVRAYCNDCLKIMEAEKRMRPQFGREDRRAGKRNR